MVPGLHDVRAGFILVIALAMFVFICAGAALGGALRNCSLHDPSPLHVHENHPCHLIWRWTAHLNYSTGSQNGPGLPFVKDEHKEASRLQWVTDRMSCKGRRGRG